MNNLMNDRCRYTEGTTEKSFSFEIFVGMGIVLVFIGRIQEVFRFLTPLRMGLIFQALALLVILSAYQKRQFSFYEQHAPEMKLMLYLFGFGFLSAGVSSFLQASISFMSISFLRNFMLFFLVANIVRNFIDIRRMVWAYVLGIVILAVPSLLGNYAGRWSSLDGSYDPNDMALLIVIALPFVFFLLKQAKGLQKIILWGALPVLLVALVATGSRGGFLGLLATMVLLLLRSKVGFFKKSAVAIIVCLGLFYLTPESYHERMSTIGAESDYNATDSFGRMQIWERGLDLIADNPLFGVGPGCFAIANGFKYAEEVGGAAWYMTAHNSFLLISAEMGVIGGGLYLAFIILNLNYMRKLQKLKFAELEGQLGFAKALEAALVCFLVSGFFLSFCYNPVSYFLVGLGVAYRIQMTRLIQGLSGCDLDTAEGKVA